MGLAVHRRIHVEFLGVGELADHYRFEAGIFNQIDRDLKRRLVVGGQRDSRLLALAVRFALELISAAAN